jgi:hypothetical protein
MVVEGFLFRYYVCLLVVAAEVVLVVAVGRAVVDVEHVVSVVHHRLELAEYSGLLLLRRDKLGQAACGLDG